ncbi:translocator protein homolog [Silene latifolia]|uniref:translocator protein homolog n=1 Tax=Silene latifolia TaxID=37657 RepID=UPI003D788A6B
MDSQNLTHRQPSHDPSAVDTTVVDDTTNIASQERQKVIAKRGLKSMGIAVSLPLILTLTNIIFFGANDTYKLTHKPNWVPPIWALHMACLGSAALMGLCGWIVWAEGGFHRKPGTVGLYLGQLGLSLMWDPLVFRMGANGVGLLVALGVCYALVQCYRSFKQVNQIAGDLVLPCLAWAGLLAFVNLKFLLT